MNRMKKVFFLMILTTLLTTGLFAHGKGDIEEISVENMNSWQEEYDLESKKKNSQTPCLRAFHLCGKRDLKDRRLAYAGHHVATAVPIPSCRQGEKQGTAAFSKSS